MTKEEFKKKHKERVEDALWYINPVQFDFFWSEIESRDGQISELQIANKMYQEDLESRDKRIKELEEMSKRPDCPYCMEPISEQMIEQFQDEDAPASIFVLSLKAGGVGITLTRANHVFHFDRWWNPAVENQATDRAFRIGQTKTVFAHKMVALGTLEERIDQMLEEKQKLSESIIGNDESWLTELDNDAFRALIQLNKNTILEA